MEAQTVIEIAKAGTSMVVTAGVRELISFFIAKRKNKKLLQAESEYSNLVVKLLVSTDIDRVVMLCAEDSVSAIHLLTKIDDEALNYQKVKIDPHYKRILTQLKLGLPVAINYNEVQTVDSVLTKIYNLLGVQSCYILPVCETKGKTFFLSFSSKKNLEYYDLEENFRRIAQKAEIIIEEYNL